MPLAPDDFPIIGRTNKYSNLALNVGHGFRGRRDCLQIRQTIKIYQMLWWNQTVLNCLDSNKVEILLSECKTQIPVVFCVNSF